MEEGEMEGAWFLPIESSLEKPDTIRTEPGCAVVDHAKFLRNTRKAFY